MVVYGTRPEAIKVAPLIRALEADPRFETSVVVTGQHRAMLDQVNRLFGITPHHDLDILRQGQTLSEITVRVMSGLAPLLAKERPDYVVVQGDTTTSTAAALAAAFAEVPVAHLEAGLRSFNRRSPFPEELNRKVTTQLADIHLAPTQTSRSNLIAEGVPAKDIVVTGNTVIDALLQAVDVHVTLDGPLEALVESARRLVIVTTHRRENQAGGMDAIGRAVSRLARAYPDVDFLYPAHLNPTVRAAMYPQLMGLPNVHITEPLEYAPFVKALAASAVVLTDSGGIQEEAPSLGKPVLVMRDTTERPEAVEAGTVRLVGASESRIFDETSALLDDSAVYSAMANAVNPYGDGLASARTVAALAERLGIGARIADFEPEAMVRSTAVIDVVSATHER
ncbi:non-hydrolyzing UDP-N-acetylglucosamine 2-epimerase [Agromyces sp. NPDC058126]|uniref:non-hydrolyzing UDP-N-acetylglucosamine 2-epimerase n=1 Tax=Agromyces sp. NPDC058126 TaxID=3346350 RepID=UPI0036D9A096